MKGLTDIDDIELSSRYNNKDKQIILKIMKVLKYWEDADIFDLDVKKNIAEHVVEELEDFFAMERGL